MRKFLKTLPDGWGIIAAWALIVAFTWLTGDVP